MVPDNYLQAVPIDTPGPPLNFNCASLTVSHICICETFPCMPASYF